MKTSTKGLIQIMGLEGVCLEPYLDSVGVWTIGVGITKYDGKDPRDFGKITIDQAISMFKDRISAYEAPVNKLGKDLTQTQFDALVSFCYNCGAGNLQKLAANRSVNAIGTALMLYTKPPEITERRQKEQTLYQYGQYSVNGKVLVFSVSASHKPQYGKGYELDVSKYFSTADAPIAAPAKPSPVPAPAKVEPPVVEPTPEQKVEGPSLLSFANSIWEWLKTH